MAILVGISKQVSSTISHTGGLLHLWSLVEKCQKVFLASSNMHADAQYEMVCWNKILNQVKKKSLV